MKNCLLFGLAMLLWLVPIPSQAQTLTVSQPVAGAVYQQNAQNKGKITVRGDFNALGYLLGRFYRVSASLQKLDLASGQPTTDPPITFPPMLQVRTVFSTDLIVDKG